MEAGAGARGVTPAPQEEVVAVRGEIAAAAVRDNVWATQFHPEKSAANGIRLLGNFVHSLGSS